MYKFKTKEFKALRAKWYKKLASEGFTDVEDSEGYLKQWDSSFFLTSKRDVNSYESTRTYFALAGQFLHEYKFKTEKELQIWSLHSSGLSVREISARLENKFTQVKKTRVHDIIKKLSIEMIKKYEASDE